MSDQRFAGDPVAADAAAFRRNFENAAGGRTVKQVASDAGIPAAQLEKILTGELWPDLQTVGALERAVGAELWPKHG